MFTVNTGKGYVPAERNRPEDAQIGYIPFDSLFSPVQQMSQVFDGYQQAAVGVDRISSLMRTETTTPEADDPIQVSRLRGDYRGILPLGARLRKREASMPFDGSSDVSSAMRAAGDCPRIRTFLGRAT